MKVDILRDRLYKGCVLASKIVGTRSNLPILSNIAITTEESGNILIMASDLELSVRLKIQAKIDEPGTITVPARKFTEYLGSLHSEKVTLESEQKQILVNSQETQARFVTMPIDDFPVLPEEGSEVEQMIVPRDELRPAIKQTTFAAARSDTHPVLSGVFFDIKEGSSLNVVATDSFRLSAKRIRADIGITKSIIVPASALIEVDQFLSETSLYGDTLPHDVVVTLSRGDNQIFFKYGQVEVIARLMEAEFPDYKKVIPSDFTSEFKVNRSELVQAIKRTSIFAAKEGQAIKMVVQSDGQIHLSAQSVEVGSHTGVVRAEVLGENVTLGFNSRYLLEGLESFNSEDVLVQAHGGTSPIKLSERDQDDYTHIIMPMSLNSEG